MSWLNWQLEYLYALQNFREITNHIFDGFFLNITILGEVYIPTLFICTIYWCISKSKGQFILFNYLFGFLTNSFLKTACCIYRPWILDSRIKPLTEAIPGATGYSFPSGHTAGAVSVWGGTAVAFWKNKFIRYFCISLVFLIMFSRNYVGVHTPQDVTVSFFVGILLLWLSTKLFAWIDKHPKHDILFVLITTIISALLFLFINFKNYPCHYLFGKLLYDPSVYKLEVCGNIGSVLGVFYGWLIEKRFIGFTAENGTVLKKIFRIIIGGICLFLLMTLLKPICVSVLGLKAGLFSCRFFIGLFITLIYPFFIYKKYV